MRSVSFFRPHCALSGRFSHITTTAGPEAVLVYLMLCHGSTSHVTGLCHALPGALARDTGLSLDGIEEALIALDRLGVIERDTDNAIVLIPGEFARQCTRSGGGAGVSPKLHTAARQRVAELAFSPLAAAFARSLGIPVPTQAEAKGTGKGETTPYRVSDTVPNTLSSPSVVRPKRRRRRDVEVHDA